MSVKFSSVGQVGSILIDHGDGNFIDSAFMRQLEQSARDAADSDVRVVIVSAKGEDFCRGGHPELFQGKSLKQIRAFIHSINQTFAIIERLPVPTIAAVHGRAMGGGFELALRCDFMIATNEAEFRFLEADFGVLPLAGGMQRLAARVGIANVSRFVMLSELIPASDLARLGVLTLVDGASLSRESHALASRLGQGPTQAYLGTKLILAAWASGGLSAADDLMIELSSRLFGTQDVSIAAAGSSAFVGH